MIGEHLGQKEIILDYTIKLYMKSDLNCRMFESWGFQIQKMLIHLEGLR